MPPPPPSSSGRMILVGLRSPNRGMSIGGGPTAQGCGRARRGSSGTWKKVILLLLVLAGLRMILRCCCCCCFCCYCCCCCSWTNGDKRGFSTTKVAGGIYLVLRAVLLRLLLVFQKQTKFVLTLLLLGTLVRRAPSLRPPCRERPPPEVRGRGRGWGRRTGAARRGRRSGRSGTNQSKRYRGSACALKGWRATKRCCSRRCWRRQRPPHGA